MALDLFTRRSLWQALTLQAALGRAAGPNPTVGFCTGTYGMKTMTTRAAIETIAEIGFDGVEPALMRGWPTDPATLIGGARRDLRMQLSDRGLAVPSMLESLPLLGTPEKRAYNRERLKLAVSLGNELSPANPPVIDTVLGMKPADWEAVKVRFAEELHDWARIAADGKSVICIKAHAGHAVDTPERAIWLLRQVASPSIRLVYDYSHFSLVGASLERSLKQLLPLTAFIAVKDSAGTEEKHDFLLPGDGKTDYLEYFRILKQQKYSGFVGVEVSALIHQLPGYQPVATQRLCYQRLAPLFENAGLRRPGRT